MITIQIDTKQVESLFLDIGRKLPKVLADTVNVLGGMIKDATINEMKNKFKPMTSGWVLNSFNIKKATPSNPVSEVFYNRGRNFMKIQVDGGQRRPKGAENLMISKGVMPAGFGYLPGPGAELDQYGNLSPGTRSRVLSYFRTYTGKNSRNNRQGTSLRSGVSFFALQKQIGRLHAGVYQRVDDPQITALRAQRAMIAKVIIKNQYKGKAGKEQRQNLMKELRTANKALLPRGISMVMAFDKIKTYTPLIKFYEMSNKIIANNTEKVFRNVADIELGNRLSKY